VLQILLDVQSRLNWLPRHALKWISRRLKVPLASIYTIGSFYEALSLEPRGAHLVEICTGTACHVRGAPRLQATLSVLLGMQPGQTDPQQVFTLKTVHCMGCCALAPVVKIDDRYYHNPTLRQLEKIIESYRQERQPSCQG
jgi:NADH-quinone oxidoreductase subunit E